MGHIEPYGCTRIRLQGGPLYTLVVESTDMCELINMVLDISRFMSKGWWIVECGCGREYQHGVHEIPEAKCWMEYCENLMCEECYEEEYARCSKCDEYYCYTCGCRCDKEWAEKVAESDRQLGKD